MGGNGQGDMLHRGLTCPTDRQTDSPLSAACSCCWQIPGSHQESLQRVGILVHFLQRKHKPHRLLKIVAAATHWPEWFREFSGNRLASTDLTDSVRGFSEQMSTRSTLLMPQFLPCHTFIQPFPSTPHAAFPPSSFIYSQGWHIFLQLELALTPNWCGPNSSTPCSPHAIKHVYSMFSIPTTSARNQHQCCEGSGLGSDSWILSSLSQSPEQPGTSILRMWLVYFKSLLECV